MTDFIRLTPQEQAYCERIRQRLLYYSWETEADLVDLIAEWSYTGNCLDLNAPVGQCQLCDKTGLRYHFELAHDESTSRLLVGSECVKRFQFDGAEQVCRDQRHLIKDAKQRSAINSLVELSQVDHQFDIDSFIDYLRDRGAFTPKQMAFLIWRFDKFHIAHDSSCFKVTIKRHREQRQLLDMLQTELHWKLKKLVPYLSTSQQAWLLERMRSNASHP